MDDQFFFGLLNKYFVEKTIAKKISLNFFGMLQIFLGFLKRASVFHTINNDILTPLKVYSVNIGM